MDKRNIQKTLAILLFLILEIYLVATFFKFNMVYKYDTIYLYASRGKNK